MASSLIARASDRSASRSSAASYASPRCAWNELAFAWTASPSVSSRCRMWSACCDRVRWAILAVLHDDYVDSTGAVDAVDEIAHIGGRAPAGREDDAVLPSLERRFETVESGTQIRDHIAFCDDRDVAIRIETDRFHAIDRRLDGDGTILRDREADRRHARPGGLEVGTRRLCRYRFGERDAFERQRRADGWLLD